MLEKAKTDWKARNQMLRNLQKSNMLFKYYLRGGIRANDSLSSYNRELDKLKELKDEGKLSDASYKEQEKKLKAKISDCSREISYAKNNLSRGLEEFKESAGKLLGKEKFDKLFGDYVAAVEQVSEQCFEKGISADAGKFFDKLDALWEKQASEFDIKFVPWKEIDAEIKDVRESFRIKDFHIRSELENARFANADMTTAKSRLKEIDEKYLYGSKEADSAFSKIKAGFRRLKDFVTGNKFDEHRQGIVKEIDGYIDRLKELKASIDTDRTGYISDLKGSFVNTGLKYEESFSSYKEALDKFYKDVFEGKFVDRYEFMFQNDNLDVSANACISVLDDFRGKTLLKYKDTLDDERRFRMIAIRDCNENPKDIEKNPRDFYKFHMREKLEYGLNYKEAEKVVLKGMTKKFSVEEITDTLQQASMARIEMDRKEILKDVREVYFEDKVKESVRNIMNCKEPLSEALDAKTYFQADMRDKIVKETDGLNDSRKAVVEKLKWAESETIKDMLQVYPIEDVRKAAKEASPLRVGDSKEKVDGLVNGISKRVVEERRADRKAAEREQKKAFEAKHPVKSKSIAD